MDINRFLEQFKIVFWDFDGVVKDSLEAKASAFENLFGDIPEFQKSMIRDHHFENAGVSRSIKIPLYMEWLEIDRTSANINHFMDRFAAEVVMKVIESPWVPGVREYIFSHQLAQKHILVTATPGAEITSILESTRIYDYFYSVYGSEVSKESAIEHCLVKNGWSVEHAVMIGDGVVDYKAAQKTGVAFTLRLTTENSSFARSLDVPKFSTLRVDE
jgi:phosphoglycolate phosphatase-like HAD superfamily hydrolase